MAQTALAVQGRNPMQALLLAATAHQLADIPATNAAVQQIFQQFGYPIETTDIVLSRQGNYIQTTDKQHLFTWENTSAQFWNLGNRDFFGSVLPLFGGRISQ